MILMILKMKMKKYLLDEEIDFTKTFESVTVPSIAAVISCNNSEPFYFIKVVENLSKKICENMWLKKTWETDLDMKNSQKNGI